MQKHFTTKKKKFRAPFWTAEIFGPLFLPRKIGINPTENHRDSIFRGKISMIFSGPPSSNLKNFKAPFLHQPPPPLQVFVNGP